MNDSWDLVTVGAGPSALAAAIYAGRAGLHTLVVERQLIGGQVATIDRVDNYPGFTDGIAGLTLAGNLEQQARRFGAEIKFGEVQSLSKSPNGIVVKTDSGDVPAKSVLIATGARYRHLGVPGESEYYGRGVHYCATCDGALYRNRELITVGGGNSAVQEALFLMQFASHITMVVRSWMKADQVLKDRLAEAVEAGRITLLEGWKPVEIVGSDDVVSGVVVTDGQMQKRLNCDGVFIFVGSVPNTEFLVGSPVKLDSSGLIVVDNHLQTSMPGVWAVGDVRVGSDRQIVSAAGDGATAAINIEKYLRGLVG